MEEFVDVYPYSRILLIMSVILSSLSHLYLNVVGLDQDARRIGVCPGVRSRFKSGGGFQGDKKGVWVGCFCKTSTIFCCSFWEQAVPMSTPAAPVVSALRLEIPF